MYEAGTASWTVVEDHADLLVLALYLRDRAGLGIPDVTFPVLEPAVDAVRPEGARSTSDADEWRRWWTSLLDRYVTDPQAVAGSRVDYELRSAPPWGAAFTEEAQRWLSQHRVQLMSARSSAPRRNRLLVNELVQDLERRHGRPARPFQLTVAVLPVAGSWSWIPSDRCVMVSETLRRDDDAFTALIRPALERLG